MSKAYFVGLLIYMDNFYLHCHCQFIWIYFRVLLIYFISYQVLFMFSVCQRCILLVYSSICTTFIPVVIVNSAGSIFLSPTNLYCVLLRSPVCQKCTFISIVIFNSDGSIVWVILIYIVSYQVLLRTQYVKNVFCLSTHLYG